LNTQRVDSAADWARQRCAEFGAAFTAVRNLKRNYLEMVTQRGIFRHPNSGNAHPFLSGV